MVKKTVNTLEDVDVNELDAAMNGKAPKAAKPHKAERLNASARRMTKKEKAPARKEAPKAEKAPKSAFRVHAMAYSDKTSTYGKVCEEQFDDLSDVVKFVESEIEKGQGNGLHEIAIHVR